MSKSIMWKYMQQEKDVLNNMINDSTIQSKIEQLKQCKAIYFVAHGSSYNAATALSSFIAKMSGIRVYVFTPSAFINTAISLYYEKRETTWVCAISQTGTSRGVIEAVNVAKEQGFSILALTNVENSPIDKMGDVTLYYQCGDENSNAKTKGYSATLVLLMMMAINLGLEKHFISNDIKSCVVNEISAFINQFDYLMETTKTWCENNSYGKNMNHLYVIGNGMNYATAMEGALKLMETQCIPTMFSDIEEFSHGMHRSLKKDSYVILLNNEINKDLMNKTFYYLKNKQINVMMINANEEIEDDYVINIRNDKYTQSILSMTLLIQIMSTFVPELNGTDPNRDANNDYTDYMKTRV